MSKHVFTEENRQAVARSSLNYSRSKQLWTFSKKQRFDPVRPTCPQAYYAPPPSTLSRQQVSFPNSIRRVFTETSQAPLPGTYNIDANRDASRKGVIFGESRDKCLTNSYIPAEPLRHPGPSDYRKEEDEKSNKGKGFTMRPKTPNGRNYFIQDKERSQVPGPSEYRPVLSRNGKSSNSRLRSTILGWTGLRRKSPRFIQQPNAANPGPNLYVSGMGSTKSKSANGCIGNALRQSFIDCIRKSDLSPGPGDYELPYEFGRPSRSNLSTSKLKGH